jgi:hypothetical protein
VSERVSGDRFVVGLYLLLVAVGGVAGGLFASVVENPEPPAYLFLVSLPATVPGFVTYGALTVATVLGIPLALVVLVASRQPDRSDATPPKD